MDAYRTEEEQVEALKRWWEDNGRSTLFAIVIALAAGFGWQAWKGHEKENTEGASAVYQNLLLNLNVDETTPQQQAAATELAQRLKSEYESSTYAQFAALHLAAMAVADEDLVEAEGQLRWVLARADSGGDVAQVTELRLARVLASAGKAERALEILQGAQGVNYAASYAMSRGDVLLQLGRPDEARDAYSEARTIAGQGREQVNLMLLEQKIQSLNPLPARGVSATLPGDPQVVVAGEEE